MGMCDFIDKYKDVTDCRKIIKKLYEQNKEDSKLYINDIIFEVYNVEDFDSFLNKSSEENIWYVLDILSDIDKLKYIIQDLIIFEYDSCEHSSEYCWDECEGFASKKDFWHWKEGV